MRKLLFIVLSISTFATANEIVNDYIQLPGNLTEREPVSPFYASPRHIYKETNLQYAIVKYKKIGASELPINNILLSSIPNNLNIKFSKNLIQMQNGDVVKGSKDQVPLALQLFTLLTELGDLYFFNTQDYRGGICFLVYPSSSYEPGNCIGFSNAIIDLHKYLLFLLHRASIAFDMLITLSNASNEQIGRFSDLLKDKQKMLSYIENEEPKEFTIRLIDVGGANNIMSGLKFQVIETSPSTQRIWEVVLDGNMLNISSNGLSYAVSMKKNLFMNLLQLKESRSLLFFKVDQDVKNPYAFRIAHYTTNSYITSGSDILPLIKKYRYNQKEKKINLDEVFK